jgi:hypothetical protein
MYADRLATAPSEAGSAASAPRRSPERERQNVLVDARQKWNTSSILRWRFGQELRRIGSFRTMGAMRSAWAGDLGPRSDNAVDGSGAANKREGRRRWGRDPGYCAPGAPYGRSGAEISEGGPPARHRLWTGDPGWPERRRSPRSSFAIAGERAAERAGSVFPKPPPGGGGRDLLA